jgi:hypothetical protein
MSADGGEATVSSPAFGRLTTSGAREACFYVDLPSGSATQVSLSGRAERPDEGFTPRLQINEYGPAGPHWYETLTVECVGAQGRCDKEGATTWGRRASERSRGRVDPCGSAVVSKLRWETSGSESRRDSGFFHDFGVQFDLAVKKFATQFAPGSTECVPK